MQARVHARPLPDDSVELDDFVPTAYQYEASRLAPGNVIATSDRPVRVAGRSSELVIAILDSVLSDEECEQLVALAGPRLKASMIVDPASGKDIVTQDRSSSGMFFRPAEDEFIRRFDRRVSELMGLPPESGEGLQVLRYRPGAYSAPHFDFLQPTNAANLASIARSGQRVSTLVMYLNDVEEGGETVYPSADISVTPRKGGAVYFEYCNSLNQLDELSLHAGSAPAKGEKWVATKWMRQKRFVSAGE